MKVQVRFSTDDIEIDQVFEGSSAEEIVGQMKASVAGRLGFGLKLVVNSMSSLRFAQEVVGRYNESVGKHIPTPASCQEFIELGQKEGIAEILP